MNKQEMPTMSDFAKIQNDESLDDYKVSTPVNRIWTDKHSVVTSSGLGDGSYDCYVAKNEAGQIIGIKIDYYLEDNEEDL